MPRPRTTHSTERRLAQVAQVDHVLDEREAGADGEAQHRGIDEKPDTSLPEQERDEEGLGGFFRERRRRIARTRATSMPVTVEQPRVQPARRPMAASAP